jgi:adenylate cyclase
MGARVARWAYRKLGPRYPLTVLVLQFQLAHLVVLGGLGLFRLYQPMSAQDFWLIVAVAEALVLVDNLLSIRAVSRMLEPVRRWLCGAQGIEDTAAAWRAIVNLPTDFFRRRRFQPLALTVAPTCAFAVALLGLPLYGFFILFAAGVVVLLYGLLLRFFAIELAMRPVLESVSRGLPADTDWGAPGLPLRWKLLLALPMINIITGVVVSGLSTNGTARLTDLGLDVVVAVGVAFTLSLEITLLITRSLLGPVRDLTGAAHAVASGDLSVRVPVTSNDELGALARAFNDAIAGLQERETLREAFGSYVAPDVAERVLAEGVELAGEELEVTIVFVDVRDFTAFAEEAEPHEVVSMLNAFFSVVVPIVTRHGGHANKYLGDGLLAVFGAPERTPDHADRAVEAALDIAREVRERYREELRIGVGVNTGPVVAGTIGGGGRVEFTVIGDAVNTAARVEAATRETGDDVLITEATRARLTREHGGMEERLAVELKGKSETVRLYAPAATRSISERAAEAGAS